MITIHGLPSSINYQELKGMIRNVSNLSEFILDELVPDGPGTKKVRVGLAHKAEANHLIDCLRGFRMRGNLLRAEPFRKAPRNQPQNNINPWASSHCPSNNGSGPSGDLGLPAGNNILQWCPNQVPEPQMLRHDFSHLYQPGESQPHQQVLSQGFQQISDNGYGEGRNKYEPEPSRGYQQQQADDELLIKKRLIEKQRKILTQRIEAEKRKIENMSNGAGLSNNSTQNNPRGFNYSCVSHHKTDHPKAPKPKWPGPHNPNLPKIKGHEPNDAKNPNTHKPEGPGPNNPNAPKLKETGPFVVNNSNAPEPKGPNSCDPNNPNLIGSKPNEHRQHNPHHPVPTKLTRREQKAMRILRKQLHEQRIKREGYVPRLAGKGGLGTFGMPCQTLLKQIRPAVCLFTRGKALTPERRKLMVVIKADIKRVLTKLVEGKGYLKAAQVVELYREHYPKETDEEYVLRMQSGIRDGTMKSDEQMRQWKGPETRRSAVGEGSAAAVAPDANEASEDGCADWEEYGDDWDEYSEDSGDEG